jgi:hypothetical protein
LPPPIRFVAHNLVQMEAALRAGAEASMTVMIETPPNAGRYWGPPYFLALVAAARDAVPGAAFDAILDCGDAPGLAVEALRQGVRAIRLDVPGDVAARVANIATQLGARLEPGPRPTGLLDLAQARDPLAAARRAIAEASQPAGARTP